MKFSVIIPAYKAAFFQEAVGSVLHQTFADWELVLVDDASPEDLESLIAPALADPRVKYFRNGKNFGAVDVVDNWNRGLGYCSGDYVICMGDDDRILPECLSNYAALIEAFPDYKLFHAMTQIIDSKGDVTECLEERPQTESSLEMLLARWKGRKQFMGDFCFDRKELIKNGGFYKMPLAWGSDDVTAFMTAKGGPGVANTSAPGFQYRWNDATITSNGSYELKVSAMMQCADWYRETVSSMAVDTVKEEETRKELLSMLDRHFLDYSRQYVREDVSRKPSRFLFWLKNRDLTRLGFFQTLVQSLKGIIL